MTDDDVITRLQRWYKVQCDGEWEHAYGVRIDTLDNPGWSMDIDLHGTNLSAACFERVDLDEAGEWLTCDVIKDRFVARCSPLQLRAALQIFLDFADSPRGK